MKKLNNEKIMIIFAMFATINIFAVDVAPRISDKEIVQNLADIKSEFKMVYGTIDNLRKEIKSEFKVVYAQIDNNFKTLNQKIDTKIDALDKKIDTKIDGLRNELKAQMNGNKKELQAQMKGNKDELNGKFNLMIGILLAMFTTSFGVLCSFIFTQLKIFAPIKIEFENFKEEFENEKLKLNKVVNIFKEIAPDNKQVKDTLIKLHLL